MSIDPAVGLTVAAWVKPDQAGFYDRVLELGNGRSNDATWLGRTEARPEIAFGIVPKGSDPKKVTGGKGSLVNGTWQFVVATQEPSGDVVIYRNGKVAGTGRVPMPSTSSRSFNYIGRSSWLPQAAFTGSIDEVAVWTRALTTAEVSTLTGSSKK